MNESFIMGTVMQANNGIFLLMNPSAGNEASVQLEQYAQTRCEEKHVNLHLHKLKKSDRVSELVQRACNEKCSVFAVAGGDGSVSLVAHELVSTGLKLGIVPTGTANVLAKDLGIPLDFKMAFDSILEAQAVRSIDAMKIQNRYCFSHLSIGAYAQMASGVNAKAKKKYGRLAYLKLILEMLLKRPSWRFDVHIDGKHFQIQASSVLLANTGHFGLFGMQWNENSKPDDGHLDVCFVHARGFFDYCILFFQFLFHKQKTSKYLTILNAKQFVQIQNELDLPIRGDGDVVKTKEFKVELMPQLIKVIVPAAQKPE